jgi:predicted choloylglycine hydrolase
MNEYIQIILTAIATGIGTGAGIAIGTYFANKALIQNIDRLEKLLRMNRREKPEQES